MRKIVVKIVRIKGIPSYRHTLYTSDAFLSTLLLVRGVLMC
jgi:hypothetical protein